MVISSGWGYQNRIRVWVILGLYWGYIGIMENRMEITIWGLVLRLEVEGWYLPSCA